MKKRLLSSLLALCMVLTMLPAPALAADTVASGDCGADGSNVTWTLYSDGLMVIQGSGDMEDYLDDSGWAADPDWEEYSWGIRAVRVESGVTGIGAYAFSYCFNLTNVEISNSVRSIGKGAFTSCEGLTGVVIPGSVEIIGEEAFSWCNGLTGVVIPGSVETIGEDAFSWCESLTDVVISDGVRSIGDYAFSWCESLTTVIFPESLEEIGFGVFDGCEGLTDIYYCGTQEQWERLTEYSFILDDLPNVTVHYEYKYDGGIIASGDCGAQGGNVTWTLSSDGLLSIRGTGDMAGFDASSQPWNACREQILTVNIGSGVTSIGQNAFYGCTGLTNAAVPESVTSIGENAFLNCGKLTSVDYGGSERQWASIAVGSGNDHLLKAAVRCAGEDYGDIVDSGYCGAQGGNVTWTFYSGGLLEIQGEGDMAYYADELGGWPWSAYSGEMKTLRIGEGITSLGEHAFYDCPGLESVIILEGLTRIEESAFAYCYNLTSVAIPVSVTSIDQNAFSMCIGLKYVYYAGTREQWEQLPYYDRNSVRYADYIYYNVEGGVPATSGECGARGGNLTWSYADGVLDIQGTGNMADFSDIYGSMELRPWDNYCSEIKTVRIGYGVTSISNGAFFNCTAMTSVDIAGTVTYIDGTAFNGCESLKEVTIPEGVLYIEWATFSYCYSLASVDLPSSLLSIGYNAFWSCRSLTEVIIPENVQTVDSHAFGGCTNLTTVTIPVSVTDLGSSGNSAFYGCGKLADVYYGGTKSQWEAIEFSSDANDPLDNAVIHCIDGKIDPSGGGDDGDDDGGDDDDDEIIGSGDCGAEGGNVTWTLYPDGLLVIQGEGAMADYDSSSQPWYAYRDRILNVKISSDSGKVTGIGRNAFYGCSNMTGAVIAAGAVSIGDGAFASCGSLTDITIPNGVTAIGNSAFYDCGSLRSAIIPEGVSSIAAGTFSGCGSLASVTIPKSVVSIGENAFSNCSGLTLVNYAGTGTQWKSIAVSAGNEPLLNANLDCAEKEDSDVLASGSCGTEGSSVTWTLYYSGLLDIQGEGDMTDYAGYSSLPWFSYIGQILTANIGSGVTSIGDFAFYGCSALKSVTIPEGVKSIGARAFFNCKSLTAVTIPESLSSIGEDAFSLCEKLTDVYYNGAMSQWKFISINSGNDPLLGANIHYADEDIIAFGDCGAEGNNITWTLYSSGLLDIHGTGEMADFGYFNSTSYIKPWDGCQEQILTVNIGDGVTSIGSFAFKDCTMLESMTVPNGVTSIGFSAFSGCSALERIDIPSTVTSIGDSAFSDCSALERIDIPSTVTSIGDFTFSGCTALERIDIPGTVAEIGSFAFNDCARLESVIIPDGVELIARFTFQNCAGLKSVTIPESVVEIGENAFSGCDSLENNYYGGNKYHWDLMSINIWFGNDPLLNAAIHYAIDIIASGECGAEGGNLTWTLNNDGLLDIQGTGKMADYNNGDDNYSPWHGYIGYVHTTNISSGVTNIGDYAFEYCYNLTGVTVPENVTYIGKDAFAGCSALSSVKFAGHPSSIGDSAFAGCGLEKIDIPQTVKTIGDDAFYRCSSLKSVKWSVGTKCTVGNYAFSYCSSLEELTIPEGVTSLGHHIIVGTAISSITIPSTVTYGGNSSSFSVLGGCDTLEEVIFTQGIKSIPSYICASASNIKNVVIPASVEEIGEYAFSNCKNLKSVNWSVGDRCVVGIYAFSECSSLEELTIPEGVTSLGYYFIRNTAISSITIPSTVTSSDVYYPDTSASLPNGALAGCDALTEVIFADGTKRIPGWICASTSYTSNIKKVVIPASVEEIGYYSFYNCVNLSGNIDILNMSTIRDYAFYGCRSLESVKIHAGNTDSSIGYRAFSGCTSLKELTLGEGVTRLESSIIEKTAVRSITIPSTVTYGSSSFSSYGALSGCDTLEEVIFTQGIKSIPAYICASASKLNKVVIHDGVEEIGEDAFSGCSLEKIDIPKTVKTIGDYAFSGCDFETVDIPEAVTAIGNCAFCGCSSLKSVKWSVGTKCTVGDYAFSECSSLEELTIPEGVKSLGYSIIEGTSISSITVPSTVTTSGYGSYYSRGSLAYCDTLEEVVFADGIEKIPDYICASASNLKNVVIPGSVKSIGDYAFYRCDNLTDVYFAGTRAQWDAVDIGSNNGPLAGSSAAVTVHCTDDGPEGGNSSAGKITFRIDSSTVYVGDTLDIIAFIPNDGSIRPEDITWSSSDESILTVSEPDSFTTQSSIWSMTTVQGVGPGTATVTVAAAGGASGSVEITVELKPNKIRLSGPRSMEIGEVRPMEADLTIEVVHLYDNITWSTSDSDIVAFDENGAGSVVHLMESLVEDSVTLYARSPGKAVITCSLDSGAKASFTVLVYQDESSKLRELALKWAKTYDAYSATVKDVLDKNHDEVTEVTIEQQARVLMETDAETNSKLVTFMAEYRNDTLMQENVYKAVAQFLADHTSQGVDLGKISVSMSKETSVTTLATSIVNSVYNGIDSRPYSYKYGNVTVLLEGFTYDTSVARHVSYKVGSSESVMVAELVSRKSQMEAVIKAYIEELLELEKNLLNEAYAQMRKSCFGKSISEFAKDGLKDLTKDYFDAMEKTGVGRLDKILSACLSYYSYVEKLMKLSKSDPIEAIPNLAAMKSLDFDDRTIGEKAVDTAVKTMEAAWKTLNDTAEEYLETGKISAGKLAADLLKDAGESAKSSFRCPVNISVYDSGGALVGYVGDDDIWADETVVYIEHYGDEKVIYSVGEKLTFDVIATDDGILNCTFEEYADGEVVGRVNYYDIPLYNGTSITAEVPGDNLSASTITVTVDKRDVPASESISRAEYEDAGVNISCAAAPASGGEVFGAGVYVRGDGVSLQASSEDNYVFLGWQNSNGALESVSALYEFTAREDTVLTALFAENTPAPCTIALEVSPAGGGSVGGAGNYEIGSYITVVAVPNSGYRFADWTEDGRQVSASADYAFTVDGNRTLTAVFDKNSGANPSGGSTGGSSSGGAGGGSTAPSTPEVPDNPDTPDTPWVNTFTDVSESDWFYGDVAYVVQNGLMTGVGNGQFDPYGTTTRGMIMTILARLDGVDTGGGNPWYQPGMEWAVRAGVSDGTIPEAYITREQLVTMLWRYAGEPAADGTLTYYPDSGNVSDWASKAMAWAVQNSIINGSEGKLNPQSNATRAEAAAMLTRFCKKIEK